MPRILATGGAITAVLIAVAWHLAPAPSHPQTLAPSMASAKSMNLPRLFEPNAGRTDSRVDYLTRGPGYAMWLTGREHVVAFGHGSRQAVIRTSFAGGRDAAAVPQGRSPLRVNSYVGKRANWRSGIATYGSVRYPGVYP